MLTRTRNQQSLDNLFHLVKTKLTDEQFLKKLDQVLFTGASTVNSTGLAFCAMQLAAGWPKAPKPIIDLIALHISLLLMGIGSINGLSKTDIVKFKNKKLKTILDNFNATSAALGTWVFTLRAIFAGWILLASDFGNKKDDVYISNNKFIITCVSVGLFSACKLINDVFIINDTFNQKKIQYQNLLDSANRLAEVYEEELPTELKKEIETATKELARYTRLQNFQRNGFNPFFNAISAASSFEGFSEGIAHFAGKDLIKDKNYLALASVFFLSLPMGACTAAFSFNSPQKMQKVLSYANAFLMLGVLGDTYNQLSKKDDTRGYAQFLLTAWCAILFFTLATQIGYNLLKKPAAQQEERRRLIEVVEDDDHSNAPDSPEQKSYGTFEDANEIKETEETFDDLKINKEPSTSSLGLFSPSNSPSNSPKVNKKINDGKTEILSPQNNKNIGNNSKVVTVLYNN